MPDVTLVSTVKAPIEPTWDFCKDMNNWVQYLKGYEKHEEQNDTESTWWIKGDVGILAKTVSFNVHIDEWIDGDKVAFSMKGVSENMSGKGSLKVETDGDNTKLTFYLEIKAGGLIGPMVNAVLGPVLKPIAEDFAGKLVARIEELQAS
jgi:carbon monoxide dehydrogenase subunit G